MGYSPFEKGAPPERETQMEETILTANALKFRYDPEQPVYALNGVSAEVKRGEFVAVLGANGCGKSTLLSLICGLLKPEKGEILLDGKSIAGEKERIGYMLQKDLLLPYKTIEENVALPLTFRGEPRKERIKKAACKSSFFILMLVSALVRNSQFFSSFSSSSS